MNIRIFRSAVLLILFFLLLPERAPASTRLFYFDFESGSVADVFYTNGGTTPSNYVAIVNNSCYAGNGCLRGNFFEGQNDSVTGLPGENDPHINIGGTSGTPGFGTYHNYYNSHTTELYVRFRYRVDSGANHRRGPLPPISSCSPDQEGWNKILYFSSTGGMNQTYNNRGITSFSYYQNSGPYSNEDHIGASDIRDGQWHLYEIYVQYETSIGAGNGIWRLWQDGVQIWSFTDVPLRVSGARFQSFAIAQFTGGACGDTGYSYDDIEIWDGMPPGDTIPDQFTFTDVTGADLSTQYTSDNVTVAGIDNTTTLALTGAGCEYSINGAAFATADDNVALSDNVALRVTSSGSYSTAKNCALNLGGVSDTYSVTTLAAANDPVAPRMRAGSMTGGWR